MSEMVERVANGIEAKLGRHLGIIRSEVARAAIEAMREPTGGMTAVIVEFERAGNDETNTTYDLWPMELAATWQAMINAALK